MGARRPEALRRAADHGLAFTATAVMVLLATVLAAAATAFAGEVTGAAVRRSLADSSSRVIVVTDQVSAAGVAAAGSRVEASVRRALPGLPVTFVSSLRSQILDLPRGGGHGAVAQAQIISLPGLAGRAVLADGSWPAPRAPAGPVPVALPVAAARLLRLAPGDSLTVRDSVTGAKVRVKVTGIFRPPGPASPYWPLSPVGRSAVQRTSGFILYGPLVTTPAGASGVPVASAAWLAIPRIAGPGAANLAAVSQRLAARLGMEGGTSGNLAGMPQTAVTTSLPALLTQLGTALLVARSQLLIGVLILLVIVAAAVAVSVRLLAVQREPEAALLVARGASRAQLAAHGAAEAAALAVPAAIIGPLLGSWLAGRAGRLGPLARAGLGAGAGPTAGAWLAGITVAAGCGLIMALPWLRRPPSAVRERVSRGRQRTVASVISAGGDLALVALAVLAGWQLASYRAPVSAGLGGALGVDPVLAAAPVLALAAGTVVTLRLLPLATRLADRAAARRRGLTLAVACWQLSRRPLRQAGPALLTVLAVATTVIALAEHSSWQRSTADQAGFSVGADERIILPPAAPLAPGAVAGLTAAPGVAASTPVVRTPVILPGGQSTTLLALDARAAAGIVPLRRDLAAAPPARLLRELAPSAPGPGVLLPGRPAVLSVTAALRGDAHTGPGSLALEMTDAAGLAYLLPAGNLPADGRPHRLTVVVAAGRHADYPLRLTGYTLGFTMPVRPTRPGGLSIESAGVAATPGGPLRPVALAGSGRLLATATAQNPQGIRSPPRVTGTSVSAGGGFSVTFVAGAGDTGMFAPSVPASLTVVAGPRIAALPGLATTAFLAATGQHTGSVVSVTVDGTPMPVRLAGVIRQFPTLAGPGGGLVVDQSQLQDALRVAGAPPVPATEWWLRTSRPPVLPPLPAGTAIIRRASLARSLTAQPLSAGLQQAWLGIAAAAVILAGAGFAVSVVTGRERARDMALLDALGISGRQMTGLLCLEQALLAGLAAAAGLILGALLSRLIIPAVSLTAQAAHPVPPVLVEIPWGPAVAIAVAIAALPTLMVAVAARHRWSTTARLRVEEAT
jgi:hypothetical protein